MVEPLGIREHGYTCREVVDVASEYVEGALPPEETTLFELHLNFCDGCFTFIDQIKQAAALSRRVSEDELPEPLRLGLLEAFRDWKRS
ncbi:MAG: anti-sigma factor [Thermoleophilia bacterium]|nr:anti-sigma factor [Thermoleophilia bacterium]